MPNDRSRQDWVGGAGYTEGPMAEERKEKEERDNPASDWHRMGFSIRDRRAQAG
jgi:hypothetical protein